MEGHALTDRQVPHNTSAEQAVLGAMLLSPDARHEATNVLDASDFYTPAHQHVYHAIATMWENGEAVDPITVADRLRSDGLLDLVGGPGMLIGLQNECPAITNADRYARLVVESSVKRRLIAELTAAVDSSYLPGSNADEVMESVAARMAEIRSGIAEEFPSGLWTFDQFLERDDAVRPPWAVPGMLRVGWRALVIASEGLGKSVLFRQVAIAAAAGIHPMLHTPIPKQVSLVVDLENPDEAIIDVCNPIVAEARRTNGEGYEHERAWLWHRPGGINLRARGDRAQLEAVIATVRPSLVCIGPLYKCYQVGGHESDEQAAGEVERVFDDLRTRYQFALMIEHHAPKKTSMSGKRDLNPYGSSLWLRWPELGITLEPIDGDVRNIRLGRFRGDRVVSSWPERLERSKPWPWRGIYPEDDLRSGVHSAGAQDPDVF
jgi:hypothetical protein